MSFWFSKHEADGRRAISSVGIPPQILLILAWILAGLLLFVGSSIR